mmetsp:Transcript_63111/g.150462  ORF Transcript_63111/g.150462 Transcript_63111/m.150462 type:complete len:513 (+) Transcript_63111:119-1657(+)
MHLLKRVGDLLDAADEKTLEAADLQTLTRESIGKAHVVLEAAATGTAASVTDKVQNIDLDLGLASGWKDLREQITGDLKDLGTKLPNSAVSGETLPTDSVAVGDSASVAAASGSARSAPSPAASTEQTQLEAGDVAMGGSAPAVVPPMTRQDTELQEGRRAKKEAKQAAQEAKRAAAQQERLEELDQAEVERMERRKQQQSRLDEVEAELLREKVLSGAHADASSNHSATEDVCERLEAELARIEAQCEPLATELNFWSKLNKQHLKALQLDALPEELQRSFDRGVWALEDEDQQSMEGLMAECDAVLQAHLEELRAERKLEHRLGQLMRESDNAMELADAERRRQEELEAQLKEAEQSVSAATTAAEAARRETEAARAAKEELEVQFREELQRCRQAAAAVSPSGEGAVLEGKVQKLRAEAEGLQRQADGIRQETLSLENRLGKHRAAAVADLERAVPSGDTGCWSAVDGPALKVVTLLMRSNCLRRSLATYLVGTYIWLFFLLFWLEKHP